jgi:hypothetical protein
LEMAEGELKVASVAGLQYGVYLEPDRRVSPPPAILESIPDLTPDPATPPPATGMN